MRVPSQRYMTAHSILIANHRFRPDNTDYMSRLCISNESVGKWTVELQTERVLISSEKVRWSCDSIQSHNMDMVFQRALLFVKSYHDREEILFASDVDRLFPVDEPELQAGGFWFENYEGTVRYVVKGRYIFRIESATGFTYRHNRDAIERQEFVKTLPEIDPQEDDPFYSELVQNEMESLKR